MSETATKEVVMIAVIIRNLDTDHRQHWTMPEKDYKRNAWPAFAPGRYEVTVERITFDGNDER